MNKKLDEMFKSDFLRLPRPFIRRFNLNTAVMLSEIYSEYTYWKERDGLQQGGWFFSTIENMYYNTGLSRHQQLGHSSLDITQNYINLLVSEVAKQVDEFNVLDKFYGRTHIPMEKA